MAVEQRPTLLRSTSVKLQRMFARRRRSATTTDGSAAASRSRPGVELHRPSSSASLSSASTFSSSTSSSLTSSSNSSIAKSHRSRDERLDIRASTFEWCWNWDEPFCALDDASFPKGFEVDSDDGARFASKFWPADGDVSPRTSLARPRLTRLHNSALDDDWMNPKSFDQDDHDVLRPPASHTAVVTPIIAVHPPHTLSPPKRTFNIRRKPPPAYIDVVLPSQTASHFSV